MLFICNGEEVKMRVFDMKEVVKITDIKTHKKIEKEEEVEYLTFTLKNKKMSMNIKYLSLEHPLLDLIEKGLNIEAEIKVTIKDFQKSIIDFNDMEGMEEGREF
jgi:hypothetical protein